MPDTNEPPDNPAAKPDAEATTSPTPQKRRPYEPPRIVSRDKLEGRANVCDPFSGKTAPPGCGVNRS
jgi:hypothetical protein